MSKKIAKRKSRGMALIFTLMVAVLAVAIASSYIGMTASSAKSARAYTKEAVALSVAQLGLESVLNAMGNPANWGLCSVGTASNNNKISLFGSANTLNLNIKSVDGAVATLQSTDQGGSGTTISLKSASNASDLYSACFGDGFLVNKNAENKILNYARVYVTNQSFPVMYGDVKKYASFIVAVVPENTDSINDFGLAKNNINYAIGVTSIITDTKYADGALAGKTFVSIVPDIISSRTVKMRVSSVYPGSVYQNVVAADFPNSGHYDQADFGYPNWEDMTANAAFIDEKTDFDGGLKIDGATNNTAGNTTNRWGAPQITRDFRASAFSSVTSKDNSNLSNYLNSVSYSGSNAKRYQNSSNQTADTAGLLRITTLDANFLGGLSAAKNASTSTIENRLRTYDPTNTNNDVNKYLPEIAKKGTANQKAVYWNMAYEGAPANSYSVNNSSSSNNNWVDKVCTSKTAKFEGEYENSNTTSFWGGGNTGKAPLLSSGYSDIMENSGNSEEGLYRKMMKSKSVGYYNFGTDSYKPDPMYANEAMEVPTIRVTISSNSTGTEDTYTLQKVSYVQDSSAPSGWKESLNPYATFTSKNKDFNGMIYVAGANVQVKGKASQSITLVSDVNPTVEKQNYDGTGVFDRNLHTPNVAVSGGYKYMDLKLSNDGSYYTEGATYSTANGRGRVISAETNQGEIAGNIKYPTYGMEEQPTGNITIIGDLTTSDKTNPSIGIVAKNRVLLNDFGHNSTKKEAKTMKEAKADVGKSTSDQECNNLTVNAVIASENHNMCFDFNNISKNLSYASNSGTTAAANEYYNSNSGHAPGDTSAPNGKTYTSSATNYGILIDENASKKLNNAFVNTNAGSDDLVSDSGATNGGRYFYYKYKHMPTSAKKMIWYDTYMGAIRGENIPTGNIYTGGTLDFHGLIISRFGDINADAGVRASDGTRINRLGYVNQLITFDSNYLDNCPPFFSMSSQNYNASTAALTWNIISYVDKGSLSW